MPAAESANAWQRPSGDQPPSASNWSNAYGVAITITPPAIARSHSPARSACPPMWMVISEAEHPVSTVTAGPSRPRV